MIKNETRNSYKKLNLNENSEERVLLRFLAALLLLLSLYERKWSAKQENLRRT